MAMIADYLIHDIQLNAILKQALNNYPNYRLIAVGHSLGAAIAALTCIGWKDNNMYRSFDPQCFGYACPPCLSSNIKNKGHHYVHCFVNEDDVVPRLNKQSIEDLIGRVFSSTKVLMSRSTILPLKWNPKSLPSKTELDSSSRPSFRRRRRRASR